MVKINITLTPIITLSVPRRGGKSKYHDHCADTRPFNKYPGLDVCVSYNGEVKNFDAYNGSLYEVKAYNFKNGNHESFLLPVRDKKEWEKESRIAKGCGYNFIYTVGDHLHPPALRRIEPEFVPKIANQIELDPANCLPPEK